MSNPYQALRSDIEMCFYDDRLTTEERHALERMIAIIDLMEQQDKSLRQEIANLRDRLDNPGEYQ